MKTLSRLKKPFGTSKMVEIRAASYLSWEDAFAVEFEDGLSFLEPHATVKKANRIPAQSVPVQVEVDAELHSHFKITYDTGHMADVSWEFIRELPPKNRTAQKRCRNPRPPAPLSPR